MNRTFILPSDEERKQKCREKYQIETSIAGKKLIIVDEPTAGLDPAERQRFLNVIREVGTNCAVIFSTHIVEDVKELCNDMAIMNGGKILKHIKPAKATKEISGKILSLIHI